MGAEDPLAFPAGPLTRTLLLFLRTDEGYGATLRLDGRTGAGARRMCCDGQPAAQPASAEQLDSSAGVGDPRLVEGLRSYLGTVFESIQLRQVDDCVDLLEGIAEASNLRQPLGEGQLAALEAEAEALATRQLALLATAGGLATTGAGAAAYFLGPGPRPLGRVEVMQFHGVYLPLECFLAERVRGIL
jgi:hypothetical protein